MRHRKKTGLILGICAGVLAIVAVGVGTGVTVKIFGEKDKPREENNVPEEMEQKTEPISYTSEIIQAGDYVTVEYPVFSGGEYQEAVKRLNERFKSEAERIAAEQETDHNIHNHRQATDPQNESSLSSSPAVSSLFVPYRTEYFFQSLLFHDLHFC